MKANRDETIKALGIANTGDAGVYDWAMPLEFQKACTAADLKQRNPSGHIVWCYSWIEEDGMLGNSILGFPMAVTPQGAEMLARMVKI